MMSVQLSAVPQYSDQYRTGVAEVSYSASQTSGFFRLYNVFKKREKKTYGRTFHVKSR